MEALERARAAYGTGAYDDATIEFLFPEVNESEEERIRKSLLAYIKGESKYLDTKKWIAWLEKQKEQKPAEPGYKQEDYFCEKCQANAFNAGRESVLKEQKPIKWTDLTWKDIVELEGIINNVHYDFRNGIGQESFGKEVLERFRNKKDDAEVDACEQKPAEWSEEDNIIKNVISYLNGEYGFKTHDDDYAYRKGLVRQLKSLRPHPNWKPSEEQMDALRIAYEIGTANESWAMSVLKSLYDDLFPQQERVLQAGCAGEPGTNPPV